MAIRFRKLKKFSTNVRLVNFKRLWTRVMLKLYWNIFPAKARRFVKNHFFSPAGYSTTAEEKRILGDAAKFQMDIHGKAI